MNPHQVIALRRAERAARIASAERFARQLDPVLGVRAAVVFGSVARGDFNQWSDIDVLVIAERLPARPLDRFAALGEPPDNVQPVVWTPAEWRQEVARSNPIAVEALRDGVWLVGSSAALDPVTP